jgi:hypothetical protein
MRDGPMDSFAWLDPATMDRCVTLSYRSLLWIRQSIAAPTAPDAATCPVSCRKGHLEAAAVARHDEAPLP